MPVKIPQILLLLGFLEQCLHKLSLIKALRRNKMNTNTVTKLEHSKDQIQLTIRSANAKKGGTTLPQS